MAILDTGPPYTAENAPVIQDVYDACRVVSFHYSAWQNRRPDRCQVPRNQELNNLLENLESIVKGYCQDVGLEMSRIDETAGVQLETLVTVLRQQVFTLLSEARDIYADLTHPNHDEIYRLSAGVRSSVVSIFSDLLKRQTHVAPITPPLSLSQRSSSPGRQSPVGEASGSALEAETVSREITELSKDGVENEAQISSGASGDEDQESQSTRTGTGGRQVHPSAQDEHHQQLAPTRTTTTGTPPIAASQSQVRGPLPRSNAVPRKKAIVSQPVKPAQHMGQSSLHQSAVATREQSGSSSAQAQYSQPPPNLNNLSSQEEMKQTLPNCLGEIVRRPHDASGTIFVGCGKCGWVDAAHFVDTYHPTQDDRYVSSACLKRRFHYGQDMFRCSICNITSEPWGWIVTHVRSHKHADLCEEDCPSRRNLCGKPVQRK